jgi:hypothetical protein
MSFRPYFLEGGTALERGLQTAAEALGQGIINRAEQTTYQNALTQLGIPLDTAQALTRLATMSKGGMTEATKMVSDYISRQGGLTPSTQAGMAKGKSQQGVENITDNVNVDENGNVIDVTQDASVRLKRDSTYDPFVNRTPKERVQLQNMFYKDNEIKRSDNFEKIKGAKNKAIALMQLQQLNDTGNLPEGLGGIYSLNADGTLKFPSFANEETIAYANTLANQLTQAKQIFGGRGITDADLGYFFNMLPSLSGTKGSRTLINRMLQVKNDLEKLDAEALEEVYSVYGTSNVSPSDATKFANEWKKPQEEILVQRLKNIFPEFENERIIEKEKKNLASGRMLIGIIKDGKRTVMNIAKNKFDDTKAKYEAEGITVEPL